MSPGDNRQCSRGAESCWWGALTWSQRMVQSLQGGTASRMGLGAGAGEPPLAQEASACPGAETLCLGQITTGQPCSCLSAEGRRLVGIPHGPVLLLPPPFPLPPFPSAWKRKQGSPVIKTFTSACRLGYELLLRSSAGRFLAKGAGEERVLRQATPGAAAPACDVGQRPPGLQSPGTASGSLLGVMATLKHQGQDQGTETLLGSPMEPRAAPGHHGEWEG